MPGRFAPKAAAMAKKAMGSEGSKGKGPGGGGGRLVKFGIPP